MEFELALDNIYIDRFRLIKIGEFWIVEYMVDLGENYIFEKVFSNKKLSVSWILCRIDDKIRIGIGQYLYRSI